jgi:hypothetical protein
VDTDGSIDGLIDDAASASASSGAAGTGAGAVDPGWARSGGRRALRLLLVGCLAPYLGCPITFAYVGQLEAPSYTGWKLVAFSAYFVLFCVAIAVTVPAVFLLQELTTWSFVHRHG